LGALVALLATSCSDDVGPEDAGPDDSAVVDAAMDGAPDAPPSSCTRQEVCRGRRCALDTVAEIEFEPGETGNCVESDQVIGGDAPVWDFHPSTTPLTSRLCAALTPHEAATDRERELLRDTGVHVARFDFRWDEIEPARGAFDFTTYDAIVDGIRALDIEILGILAYGVPWATTMTDDDKFVPPDDPADFASFARAAATHFDGRVQRWEVWNEENGGYRFWHPTLNGDAAAYARLLDLSTTAIHDACPDCEVISGGLFYHEQLINGAIEFAHDMLTADPHVLDDVDAFGIHPYAVYPPTAPPEQDDGAERALGAIIHDMRRVLDLHGVRSDLPIVATELGWPSYGAVDEEAQARFLTRVVLLSAALDLDPICWFNVTDGPNHGTFPPEDDFGLYRFGSQDPDNPVDPKPAREAMRWLAAIGDGATFVASVDDPALHAPEEGRFALDFDSPAGGFRALFALSEYEATLEGETRPAYDHLGRPLTTTGPTHSIGPDPIFFVPPAPP
jgi:hypothetical protein